MGEEGKEGEEGGSLRIIALEGAFVTHKGESSRIFVSGRNSVDHAEILVGSAHLVLHCIGAALFMVSANPLNNEP